MSRILIDNITVYQDKWVVKVWTVFDRFRMEFNSEHSNVA
jgi:hypothetical protein